MDHGRRDIVIINGIDLFTFPFLLPSSLVRNDDEWWSLERAQPSEFYLLFIIFGLELSLMSESNVVISRDMRQVGWTRERENWL